MPHPKNARVSAPSKDARQTKPQDLGGVMFDWAVNEMKFMPQGRHAGKKLPDVDMFTKLCRGKGFEYWEHIVQHVKSSETVNKIRMNLVLSNKAGGENEEAQRIRKHHELTTQRDLLRGKVEKQQIDMEKVVKELSNSERDLNRIEANYQSQLGRVDETLQCKVLLSTFSHICGQEKKKLEDYQSRISLQLNKYKLLVSKLNESSQFYSRQKSSLSNEGGLESACTKEIRETCELIAKYIIDKPTNLKLSSQQQEQIDEKISGVMATYPASQILESLIEVTNETALDIQLQTQAINISDDVHSLQFKRETTGELEDISVQPSIQQSVDQLIERSQLEHVLRFVTIQKHKNTVHNLERQLAKTKQDCNLALQQNLGGLPDLMELTKMVLESEIKCAGSQAGLKCLHRLDNELTQRHVGIEMEKSSLQQKYQMIQDFDKLADGKQNLIKALVRHTRNTPTRLRQQNEEILAYIDQSLRSGRNDVTTLASEMSGTILNEMKIFSSISVANLPVLVVGNLGRISRRELDINRFRPELVTQNVELFSALEKLGFPHHQAPELLLQICVEAQSNLSDFQRHSTAREVPDCAQTGSKIADVLAKVDRHDQLVKERILPKIERCLAKSSDSLADCLELKNLVDIWWDQPGQYAAPWVAVEGKTFQEYKDEWTILCTRLRQLQRS